MVAARVDVVRDRQVDRFGVAARASAAAESDADCAATGTGAAARDRDGEPAVAAAAADALHEHAGRIGIVRMHGRIDRRVHALSVAAFGAASAYADADTAAADARTGSVCRHDVAAIAAAAANALRDEAAGRLAERLDTARRVRRHCERDVFRAAVATRTGITSDTDR